MYSSRMRPACLVTICLGVSTRGMSDRVGVCQDVDLLGGVLHGLFKSICRSGANPEKTLRIRGGVMQVYHHNQ